MCAMCDGFFSLRLSAQKAQPVCVWLDGGMVDGTALFDFHNFFPSLPYDKQVVVCVRSMKDPNTTITTAAAVIQFFFIL